MPATQYKQNISSNQITQTPITSQTNPGTNQEDIIYKNGLDLFGKSDYDNAINDFEKVIAMDPKNANAYANIGIIWHYRIGDGNPNAIDNAISNYSKAINLGLKKDILNDNLYNLRGSLYEQKDDYDNALSDFNNAIATDPKNDLAYFNRARIWEIKGELNNAISDLSKAVTLNPGSGIYKTELENDQAKIK